MAIFAVVLTAFMAAALSMYSGFGLGTVLLPAFALFMPVEAAVLATAVVHGANNLFKAALLGRLADPGIVIRFGVPAVAGALLGALTLGWVAQLGSGMSVAVDDLTVAEITPVKLVVGALMLGFAAFELLPRFRRLSFAPKWLPLGGALSGFFGGLSGHQGALRSAFLSKSGFDTQTFVGSNAVIGLLVDISRLLVYLGVLSAGVGIAGPDSWPLVTAGAVAAFAGVLFGRRYLHKVTMRSVQVLVGSLLGLIGAALLCGLL